MPLPPLTGTLSNGQKVEVLKRFRERYSEELAALEAELLNLLTAQAEADYLAGFIGEQPEVAQLRGTKEVVEEREKRRQMLGRLLERLDQIIPEQPAIGANPPVGSSSQKVPVRRF